MSTGKYHETLRRLHDEYGVNVRIGEFFDRYILSALGPKFLRLYRAQRNFNHRHQRHLLCPWCGRDA